MKILHVVGARPNFMKVAPVVDALKHYPRFDQFLVHTGQHYDKNMSKIFFEELDIPEPDTNLEVGSGSHTYQAAHTMLRLEAVLNEQQPDVVLVYGDINSTLAASLVCAQLQIPLGHVEAGLRSHDLTMPEEINRMVTDRLATYLFTPSRDADQNLLQEGCEAERMAFVGNVMIDTLVRLFPRARPPHGFPDHYALITLHRPSNVDDENRLRDLMHQLDHIGASLPIVFPIHPRTRKRLDEFGIPLPDPTHVSLIEPVGYLDFLGMYKNATLMITDSGGIQEETTYLGIPCLTLRENTERPVTVSVGTNILIGHALGKLSEEVDNILLGKGKQGAVPELWDGKAGHRIASFLHRLI